MKESTGGEASLQLEDQLCFSTYAAANAFGRLYKRLLGPLDLTYTQFLVLLVLWERDERGVADIGERLGLDSGTLSPVIKRLEHGGQLVRSRCQVDERRVIVSLTSAGRSLQEQVREVRRAVFRSTGLTADQLRDLNENLCQLRNRIDSENEIP